MTEPSPTSTTPSHESTMDLEKLSPSLSSYQDPEKGFHTSQENDLHLQPTHPLSPSSSKRTNTLKATLSHTVSRFRTRDDIDPGPPPDGGKQAWLTAVLTHLVIFNTWGFINSFGLFETYYVDVLHLGSASAVSWIGSLQVFILFGLGTLSGRATDAGYFRLLFVCGWVVSLVGIFTLSCAKTYWQVFLAQAICLGLGNGLVFVPATALMASYFGNKNRGKAFAIVTTGSATGGLVFPAIAERLLPRIGYGWTIRVIGLVMAVCAVVCFIGLKPRLPPRKTGPIIEWAAFKEPPYALYTGGAFFLFVALYVGFYYVGSFGRSMLGTSQLTSINLLLTMNGSGVLARIIPNFISDRWTGPLNLMIPFAATSALVMYSWMAVDSVTGLWTFAVFYGVFAAGIQGLFPVVLTSLTHDPQKLGVRTGMGFAIMGCAVLIGPPIAGALITADGGRYVGLQAFAGSCMVVGSVILLGCRWSKVGWRFKVKV